MGLCLTEVPAAEHIPAQRMQQLLQLVPVTCMLQLWGISMFERLLALPGAAAMEPAEKALQQHEPVAEPLLDLLHMVEPEQEDDEYVPAQQAMRLLRTAAHRRQEHALQSLCRLLGCKAVDPHQLAQLLQEVLHSRNYEAAKVLLLICQLCST
ncbi:hypothetical protein OEZ86_000735 [Tetradesmus obliquus]|nr:hypothetical protein OEZ86_000735 [Tetradesmus obliquus]